MDLINDLSAILEENEDANSEIVDGQLYYDSKEVLDTCNDSKISEDTSLVQHEVTVNSDEEMYLIPSSPFVNPDQSFMYDNRFPIHEEVSKSIVNMIHTRVFHDLRIAFNRQVKDYFDHTFHNQLEQLVEVQLQAMANTSMLNSTSLAENTKEKCDLEQRLSNMEETLSETINPALDKLTTKCESLETELKTIKEDIATTTELSEKFDALEQNTIELKTELAESKERYTKFVEQSDANLATVIQEKEIADPKENSVNDGQLRNLQEDVKKLYDLNDAVEQNHRLNTVEFHKVPYRKGKAHTEDTTQVIIDLVCDNLQLNINKYDISVCHRQHIPGVKNVPQVIYCRFVNRVVAQKIIARKHYLKFKRSTVLRQIEIRENLTLVRRRIRDQAETDLPHYRFKWVKNGNVFIRKTLHSKAIRISNKCFLDQIIAEEKVADSNTTSAKLSAQPPEPLREQNGDTLHCTADKIESITQRECKNKNSQKIHDTCIPPDSEDISICGRVGQAPKVVQQKNSLLNPNDGSLLSKSNSFYKSNHTNHNIRSGSTTS